MQDETTQQPVTVSMSGKTIEQLQQWAFDTLRRDNRTVGYDELIKRVLRAIVDSHTPDTADETARRLEWVADALRKKPKWDAKRGELTVGKDVGIFPAHAHTIRPILDTFEAAGWPSTVENTVGDAMRAIHSAISRINRSPLHIRFHASETCLSWEPDPLNDE